jgi:hypothetical protein
MLGWFRYKSALADLKIQQEKLNLILENERLSHKIENDNLRARYEREQNELQSLLKLDQQQQLAQAKLDLEREKDKLVNSYEKKLHDKDLEHAASYHAAKTNFAERLSEQQIRLSENHFQTMKEHIVKMNIEGTETSKFMQEIALKMFEKPSLPAVQDINVRTGEPTK